MPQDDLEFDASVEWLSLEMPSQQHKPRRSWLPYLAIAGAVALVVLTMVVATKQIIRRTNPVDVKVSAHGLGNSAELRAESVKAYQEYDASVDPLTGLSEQERQERQAIKELFEKVQSCAGGGASQQPEDGVEALAPKVDPEEFQKLVDYDRLTKRVELTGRIDHYSPVEKKYLRTELKNSLSPETYWAQIIVAKVLSVIDDPSTRVVYAYCAESLETEHSEVRFIIAWDGKLWKLYDWERLDLGTHVAEEWGIYAQYGNSSSMDGYVRWGECMGEVDALVVANDRDAARAKMETAESQVVPPELDDLHWLLTAYRWQSLGDNGEAQRCFEKVSRPQDLPGAYYGLMNSHRLNDVQQALEYAELYEQAVGPSVDLCLLKASLFETMHRKDQAIVEWKKVLQIYPENDQALRELFLALPKEDKAAIKPLLVNLNNPAETLEQLGQIASWQDYEGLLFLVKELEEIAPASPATFHLQGLAQQQNGDFQAAAEYYRQAFEAETDTKKIDQYSNAYIEVMSLNGQGVAAWQSVPNQKSAFEMLAYNYDDLESSLSVKEFREIAELYRKQYPDSPDGYYYSASTALDERRYQDAEQILREGLQLAAKQTDDEESMIDSDSLSALLATALYEQDRLSEAYEVTGNRKQRFAQLARLAVSKEHFDKVRKLIEMHRQLEPDDPYIHFNTAELAAQEKQWDLALEELQAGLVDAPEDWMFKNRLQEVYVESGRSLEYYTDSDDQKDLFGSLAQSLISDRRWESLYALVAEHRQRWPDDPGIASRLAEAAWKQKDYAAYIKSAEDLLQGKDADNLESYETQRIENQLLQAYLRTNAVEQAGKLALKRQQTQYDSTSLAVVKAANGELEDAKRLAVVAASENDSASQLYSNEDVGQVFLSRQFDELHDKYPLDNFHGIAPTSVIFLAEEPWPLDAGTLGGALEQAAVGESASIKPLKSVRPEVTAAFVVSLGHASIWVAAGTGKFNPDWQFQDDTLPLAATANQCSYWLACGPAAWTQTRREQVEEPLRALAAQLSAEKAKAFCAKEMVPWEELRVYPASTELINLWRKTGDMKSVQEEGLPIISDFQETNLAKDRQFENELREAARKFASSPENELNLLASLNDETGLCTVRLKVSSLQRRYGSQVFVGKLVTTSELIPELRQGLNLLVNYDEIYDWQLNSDPPTYRAH